MSLGIRPVQAKILLPLLLLSAALILGSCARTIGYGLVLWAGEESPVRTGEILAVRQESQIQQTYLVRLPGTKELAEIPIWRMRLFSNKEDAIRGAEEYAPFQEMYAYSQREGLPLREKADQEARRVYKLDEGQLVKVLSREEQQVTVGSYEDYWYLVLTEDGYEGWCFGYYLPVFRSSEDPKEEVRELMARDPMLEALLETEWRPEYFQEMVDNGRFDLTAFGTQFGFFVDPDNRRLRLVVGKRSYSYEYERLENVGANRYVFEGPGISRGGIRVNMQTSERIVVTYTVADQVLSTVFIAFSEDIEELVTQERERRERLAENFSSRGRILRSSAYGNIVLEGGMRFRWEEFGRLGEQIFLRSVRGSGTVDFPYYLSSRLPGAFDGVITFRFNEYEPDQGTTFLYSFDSSGVRFEYVRPQGIENLEVVRRDGSPLVIYFSFGGS
ncbi:MAG: SH3 domain-containing protein [Spirochaetaceae bacterium]|nr:MAG: SH3 domain-containing protein [Spirochaetaceae bacterium]